MHLHPRRVEGHGRHGNLIMAFGTAELNVTIHVLGLVESNLSYTDIYTGDPITIGIMQWYGVRAGRLISRIRKYDPAGYALLPGRLRSLLESAGPSTSAWNSLWLRKEELAPIRSVMVRPLVKWVQHVTANQDMGDYLAVAKRKGIDPDVVPKTTIMFIVSNHQWPVGTNKACKIAGPNPSLDKYMSALRSVGGSFTRYWSRYTKAKAAIDKWDTSPPFKGYTMKPGLRGGVEVDPYSGDTLPGTPGADDGGGGGGGGDKPVDPPADDGDNKGSDEIRLIQVHNGSMVVHWTSGTKQMMTPTQPGMWLPVGHPSHGRVPGDDDDDGDDGGGGTPPVPPPSGKYSLPVAKGKYRISAGWGATGAWARYHTGTDFAGAAGTPLLAVMEGVVVSDTAGSWAGNHVSVRYGTGESSMYCHCSKVLVKVGDRVTAGQTVGLMGQTGRAFGVHCHFEYYPKGITPGNIYSSKNCIPWLKSLGLNP